MTQKFEKVILLASAVAKKDPDISVSDLKELDLDETVEEFLAALRKMLTSAGIDLEKWGRGSFKSLEHFAHEIIAGETVLSAEPDGSLVRAVDLACVDITYHDLKLVEERQVFEDGRVRIRSLSATVTEKILPGETPEQACIRGIEEELGITTIDELKEAGIEVSILESPSYPGLNSKYTVTQFTTTIDSEAFNPEGYVEQNTSDGLTAYFKWRAQNSEV